MGQRIHKAKPERKNIKPTKKKDSLVSFKGGDILKEKLN